jgi:uncharacterized BrkB/YihY/UPF0761 family membrane protein
MSSKLSVRMKKRFYMITFLVLPILFSIGFFISVKIAVILNFHVDDRGTLLVAFSFVPLYFMCIFTVYRVLLKKSQENQ